ncbi:ASCH domain-containing protein [Corynebacterium sp. TA-R-1]|uniref:ASCH domain-containing protein n=1 Tax=Corynebacterium stercoris TaxID=2943490 RepID=A0ABT1G4R6_9CORY|nr:ASCH domain-containing protein [Corynebacterium stercoris]
MAAFAFGNTPEMADTLLSLVLSGAKTGTTSWPCDPDVRVGVEDTILDGRGEPAAVIRYVRVEQVPFNDVNAEFAASEGEGDLSLEYWRSEHKDFFTSVDPGFSEDEIVQCETFELVYTLPRDHAPQSLA